MPKRDIRWKNMNASVAPAHKPFQRFLRFEIQVRFDGTLYTSAYLVDPRDFKKAQFDIYGEILDLLVKEMDKALPSIMQEKK